MELNVINMYPDVLNLYGDSGNITCIKQRAKWRGITLNIQDLTVSSDVQVNEDTDMILIGGGSDSGQSTVATNLLKQASALENYIENESLIETYTNHNIFEKIIKLSELICMKNGFNLIFIEIKAF